MSVDRTPSRPRAADSGHPSFWTSLPGLLTAIAGLLTAILAVCTFAYQVAGPGKDDASQPGDRTPESAGRPSTTAQAASDPAVAAGVDEPLWHGKLLFTNSGIDFDVVPPKISAGAAMDFYDGSGYQIAPLGSTALLAKWTGSGTPTAADCADLLAREGVSTVQKYFQGAKFCLRSKESHMIVSVTFLGPKSGAYQIDATVWAPRD